MLSEVPYATFANYSPRGQSKLSQDSRTVCGRIKAAHSQTLDIVIKRLSEPDQAILLPFLSPETTLVPIPGSAPLAPNAVSPPRIICEKLQSAGFGKETLPILTRIKAVPKSAFASPGERPSLRKHYETLKIDTDFIVPEEITLVDDVLTRGRTSFACAMRLNEVFPQSEIRIFSVIRTQGLIPEISKIRDPDKGTIKLIKSGTDVDRNP